MLNSSSVVNACVRCSQLERVQIPDLGIADDLHPVIGEELHVPGKRQSRAVEILVPDLVLEPVLAVQLLELEAIRSRLIQESRP